MTIGFVRRTFANLGVDRSCGALLDAAGGRDGVMVFDSRPPELKGCAYRRTFVMLNPVLRLSCRGGVIGCVSSSRRWTAHCDLWSFLKQHVEPLLANACEGIPQCVPAAGGYLAYELLESIEPQLAAVTRFREIPDAVWCLYRHVVEIPHDQSLPIFLYEFGFDEYAAPIWQVNIELALERAAARPVASVEQLIAPAAQSVHAEDYSDTTRDRYCAKVSDIRERIAAGDVYQVNLSQRFTLPFQGPYELFHRMLRGVSPAAHQAFMRFEGGRSALASASPERFLYRHGSTVLCSPIKGTRPRGRDGLSDGALAAELVGSPKDRAELAMIVDLVRNDLGKVARRGSICVRSYPRLETLAHVHHLVGDITATLADGMGTADLVRALFPSGSITGAPKVAAMKAIAELEEHPRGPYTGAVGVMGPGAYAELSVAIRTALLRNQEIVFNAGGGVVWDSDPEAEYLETLHKARGLLCAWQACTRNSPAFDAAISA